MPSLWDLLCVSRQKYSTHDTSNSRLQRRWEEPAEDDQSEADHYVRPHYSFQRGAESFSEDSLTWVVSDRRRPMTELVSRESEEGDVFSTGLKDRSAHDRSNRRKKQPQWTRPLSQAFKHGRSKKTKSNERKRDVDNEGKRRHVQDIFLDNSQYHDATHPSLNTSSVSLTSSYSAHSSRSKRRSQENSRPRQTESMYQYTPRSVDDNAISAALFGNRMDDFIHDPSWNRAIDRFAASPTSGSSFSFSEQSVQSPDKLRAPPRKSSSPRGSDGSVMYPPAEFEASWPNEKIETMKGSQSHDILTSNLTGASSSFDRNEKRSDCVFEWGQADGERRGGFNVGVLSVQGEADDFEEGQPGSGPGVDIEKLFSSNGDVLY